MLLTQFCQITQQLFPINTIPGKSDRRAQDVQWMSALKRPKRSVEAERRQEPTPRVSGSAIALKTKKTSSSDDVILL